MRRKVKKNMGLESSVEMEIEMQKKTSFVGGNMVQKVEYQALQQSRFCRRNNLSYFTKNVAIKRGNQDLK